MELIITASVGLVQSGQHLEHNAQRQNAPTRSTSYSAATIEGNKIPLRRRTFMELELNLFGLGHA